MNQNIKFKEITDNLLELYSIKNELYGNLEERIDNNE